MKLLQNVFASRRLKLVFAAAVLIGVSGCAHHKRPVTTIDFQKVKTVGVYSNCGSKLFRVRHPAFNFGSRDIDELDIRSWGLDARILDVVKNNTASTIDYKSMNLNEELVWEAFERRYTWDNDTLAWNMVFENAPPYDLYLVFVPGRGGVGSGDGLGVYTRLGMGFTYQLCMANIYDPKTHSIIRRYGHFAQKYADRDYRENTWEEYSASQLQKVKERMIVGVDALAMKIANDIMADPSNINGPRTQ